MLLIMLLSLNQTFFFDLFANDIFVNDVVDYVFVDVDDFKVVGNKHFSFSNIIKECDY
jgi:hypothetical protein